MTQKKEISKTKEETKKRIDFFDNIKGILIVLVVLGHALYANGGMTVSIIYTFHMEAFVFISGYFSKSENSKSGKALFKLLVTYLIFNSVMLLYYFSAYRNLSVLTEPYYSMWYLLSLIVWRFASRYIPANKKTIAISVAVAFAVGFFAEIDNRFAFARIICFYPFFLAGMMLDKQKTETFFNNRKPKQYITGTVCVIISLAVAYLYVRQYHPKEYNLQMFAYTEFMDLVERLFIFAISSLMIFGLMFCTPDKNIPILTKAGKNSLSIYLLHRIITLIVSQNITLKFVGENAEIYIAVTAVIETAVIVILFGTDSVSEAVNKFISAVTEAVAYPKKSKYSGAVRLTACILAIFVTLIPVMDMYIKRAQLEENEQKTEYINPYYIEGGMFKSISDSMLSKFENSTKLLFCGDLIMLEDQVRLGYDGEKYNFDSMFEYTKDYISSADFAIGVFEGPTAGEKVGYSTSNYGDDKPLYINYPDEFAETVKNAGFDLVTTANNHFLDKSVDGAMRTLDVLDSTGLDHVGTYRNQEEKNKVKIVEVNGIKIAVLAYTYGSNYCTEDSLLSDEYSYMTHLTVDPASPNFDSVKDSVKKDFDNAKKQNPDLIIVLPHMGEQFLDAPDNYQTTWNDIFFSYGADMVLNDHTHSVQPVEVKIIDDKKRILVNCPGNFANIYREENGDASAMIEIYIDNSDKSPLGLSVIPMWTEASANGNYRAIPIYDLVSDSELRKTITTHDLDRIDEVQRHITRVMLGNEMGLSLSRERYYVTEKTIYLPKCEQLEIDGETQKTALYQKIISAKSVCYAGDSVTDGYKNGGFGWYRPIESLNPKTTQSAMGGGTTKTILPEVKAESDFYVVAIGTNDVRYREENKCAMTSAEYISELENFVKRIRNEKPEAEFCFIAPWYALDFDDVSALDPDERDAMLAEYTKALEEWCKKNHHTFSDPNGYLKKFMEKYVQSDYMLDFIHPNSTKGIKLYSQAVLDYSVSY